MAGEVIYLKLKSPHVEEDVMAFLSCVACKNKTYNFVLDKPGDFPLMRCACCGAHIGRMGWAHDDDPLLNPFSGPGRSSGCNHDQHADCEDKTHCSCPCHDQQ